MPYDACDFPLVTFLAPTPLPNSPGLSPENLAKVSEMVGFLQTLPPTQFDMRNPYLPDCGSAACIMGWTAYKFDTDTSKAAEIFGFDTEVNGLFYPGMSVFAPRHRGTLKNGGCPYSASPSQAAAVILNYLSTGKVDWSVA